MRISDAFSQQSVLKVRFPYPIVVVVVVGFHHEMMVDLVKARHRKRNAPTRISSTSTQQNLASYCLWPSRTTTGGTGQAGILALSHSTV